MVLEVDASGKRILLFLKSDPAGGGGKKCDKSNREEEPQDDFQAKLAKLKGMFK